MSVVLSVYSQSAYKEFVLPAIRDAETVLPVDRRIFHLQEDLELGLEIICGTWSFLPSPVYRITGNGESGGRFVLTDQANYRIETRSGERLFIIVRVKPTSFIVYDKYDISFLGQLVIGSSPDAAVVYTYYYSGQQYITKHHAVISRGRDGTVLQDSSKNGVFINDVRVRGSRKLEFGDNIHIWGLDMVYLGNVLAIRQSSELRVDPAKLPLWNGQAAGPVRENHPIARALYHRAPRKMETLAADPVEIKAPPAPRQMGSAPLLMTAGPALTMIVPILFSCAAVGFGSQAAGAMADMLTYTGIITAAASAVIGAVWAVKNTGYAEKKAREEEESRLEAYGKYLNYCENVIQEKYDYNAQVMNRMYPSAEVCAEGQPENEKRLWERNASHRDFLKYRIGIGDVPFQVPIRIPGGQSDIAVGAPVDGAGISGAGVPADGAGNYGVGSPADGAGNYGVGAPADGAGNYGVGSPADQAGNYGVGSPADQAGISAVGALADKPGLLRERYRMLHQVPICLDLRELRMVGIIGGRDKVGAYPLAYALAAQAAAMNSYTDVKMAFAYDGRGDGDERWEFARWLPHSWSPDRKFRYVAGNKSEASDLFYELTKILRSRSEEGGDAADKGKLYKPYYILFVEQQSYLEGEPIARYLFDKTASLGITVILLAESYEDLPNSCEYMLQNDAEFKGLYRTRSGERTSIRFDRMNQQLLEKMARHLANMEVNEAETGGEIPDEISFFDLYGVSSLDEFHVAERWRKSRTYENMRALVGQRAGGAPCFLDVHEKYHGPHGLVAGTTGSGKSEMLQTYILSLALNFSPDDVGFFIIDYKGGGMANLFSDLPHMLGKISNLSGSQVRRAMVSIKSENRRRQRIFGEYGVNNINAYTMLYKNGEAASPVPHLFIVIDEFAELKREEPDFMKELISVAQVGRSLGVHLILATQKPGGTVDDNIWSNSKFRLCLRVQDRQDSIDMLHKPDAAYLTRTGRCYLQVGNDELYEQFQVGWSGAVYEEDPAGAGQALAMMLDNAGRAALVGAHMKRRRKEHERLRWIERLCGYLQTALDACPKADAGERAQNSAEQTQDVRERAQAFAEQVQGAGERVQAFAEQAQGAGERQDSAEQAQNAGERAQTAEERELSAEKKVYALLKRDGIDFAENESSSRALKNMLHLYDEAAAAGAADPASFILKEAERKNIRLPEIKDRTQLDALVDYLAETAEKEGYQKPRQLWLPVLPASILLKQLDGYADMLFDGQNWPQQPARWELSSVIGLCDDPVRQAQTPLMINFTESGHHAVCGRAMSGRSTFIQSLVYGLIHRYSPEYLNIYMLDFSGRMLRAFEGDAHVGGILYENDLDTVGKLFHLLDRLVDERKKLFKGGSYTQYVMTHGAVCPAVLVVIDNVAGFREKTQFAYDDALLNLSRDCAAYGIYLLLSGAGFSSAEIPPRMRDNIHRVVCLEMADRFRYGDCLGIAQPSVVPEAGIPGRGLAVVNGEPLEFQTALSVSAADDYQRGERIAEECARLSSVWSGRRARPIPRIPEKPEWAEYARLEEVRAMTAGSRLLPAGYDMATADLYSVDLSRTYCYLISGKARTGKTNFLEVLALSAAAKGGRLVIVEFDGAELAHFADEVQARYIADYDGYMSFMSEFVPEFQRRNRLKKQYAGRGMDEAEIFEEMSRETPWFIFLSDLVSFVREAHGPEGTRDNLCGAMGNLFEKGFFHGIYFFACMNQDQRMDVSGREVYEKFIRFRTGVHLGGGITSQRIFEFSGMPFSEQSAAEKPGIGAVPPTEQEPYRKIVIPLVKGSVSK